MTAVNDEMVTAGAIAGNVTDDKAREIVTAALSNTGENAYVALLRHNDDANNLKAALVPPGQTLDFDEGAATRRWLWPYLGHEFHLVAFVPLEAPK